MHNEFQLVKRKRQRKRKPKLGSSKEDIYEAEVLFAGKFKKALQSFKSSQFCTGLLQTIESCLKSIGSDSISEILCYALGNFCNSKSSLHQLAALVEITKKYNAAVFVYDPVFSPFEIKVLDELGFHKIQENEEGKRKISVDKVTLAFFPHCPKQLINNFLWANWSISLQKCILITNSFQRIIQNNTNKTLLATANYLLEINQKTEEVPLEDCYRIENIFNDTSVHYFKFKDSDSTFFAQTFDKVPFYTEETELITKTFQNLTIQNEQ